MKSIDENRTVFKFLLIAFSTSWTINFIVDGLMPRSIPILYWGHVLSMLMPAIAAVYVLKIKKIQDFKDFFPRIQLKLYLFAIAYPLIMWGSPLLISIARGKLQFIPPERNSLYWVIMASLTVNIVAGFGEEFGWRGFLLTRLMKKGIWVGFFLHGIIWGAWHYALFLAPFCRKLFLSGINAVDWLLLGQQLIVVTASSIVMGFILGWLWLKYKNILLLAVLHGYLNAFRDVFQILFPGFLSFSNILIAIYIFQVLPVMFIVFTNEFKNFKSFYFPLINEDTGHTKPDNLYV